jgi:hypothetical protein
MVSLQYFGRVSAAAMIAVSLPTWFDCASLGTFSALFRGWFSPTHTPLLQLVSFFPLFIHDPLV